MWEFKYITYFNSRAFASLIGLCEAAIGTQEPKITVNRLWKKSFLWGTYCVFYLNGAVLAWKVKMLQVSSFICNTIKCSYSIIDQISKLSVIVILHTYVSVFSDRLSAQTYVHVHNVQLYYLNLTHRYKSKAVKIGKNLKIHFVITVHIRFWFLLSVTFIFSILLFLIRHFCKTKPGGFENQMIFFETFLNTSCAGRRFKGEIIIGNISHFITTYMVTTYSTCWIKLFA